MHKILKKVREEGREGGKGETGREGGRKGYKNYLKVYQKPWLIQMIDYCGAIKPSFRHSLMWMDSHSIVVANHCVQ